MWVHGARRSIGPDYTGELWSRYGLWAALGWPYEMGMFAACMVASGVLDRYQRLRFFLHHSGGMVPIPRGLPDALRAVLAVLLLLGLVVVSRWGPETKQRVLEELSA